MFNVLIQLKSKAVLKKCSYLTIVFNVQAYPFKMNIPALPVFSPVISTFNAQLY
jgi:hypothetical protein